MLLKNTSGKTLVHPITHRFIAPDQYYDGPIGEPHEEDQITFHNSFIATSDVTNDEAAVEQAVDAANAEEAEKAKAAEEAEKAAKAKAAEEAAKAEATKTTKTKAE